MTGVVMELQRSSSAVGTLKCPASTAAGVSELPYRDIDAWFARNVGQRAEGAEGCCELAASLAVFVRENATPSTSLNYKSEREDDLTPLLDLVGSVVADHGLLSSALTCLKILSRKEKNRRSIELGGLKKLAACADFVSNVPSLAAECANVVLNFCYERRNVLPFVSCHGVGVLSRYLDSVDDLVQANAAGALQSISFHEEGRRELRREEGLVSKIVGLLRSETPRVRARSAGALHNLSSDPGTIHAIRVEGGIAELVRLLKDGDGAVAASAAGTLQNVSREVASRSMIRCASPCHEFHLLFREPLPQPAKKNQLTCACPSPCFFLRESDAVKHLADLLCCDHVQCQVCAAGALMNVLGPEISTHPHSKPRKAFSKLISQCLTLGIIYSAVLDESCSGGRVVA